MGFLSWETPRDRQRAIDREGERADAIRRLAEEEQPISLGGMPAMPSMGAGVETPVAAPPGLPSVPTARPQVGPSILPVPGDPTYEPYGRVGMTPRDIEAVESWREEYERRYQENLDIRLSSLERRNARKVALGYEPDLTVEGEEEAARQHAVSVMTSKERTTPLSLATGAMAPADIPRQLVKEHVIEPIVPEFELPIPREVLLAPIPVFGPLLVAGSLAERGAGALGAPEVVPRDVKITSGMVEEAASWVLDPINLAFFIGPELRALRAAGGALRAANRIRQTKNIPAYVKAAMRVAQSEAGGAAARRGAGELPVGWKAAEEAGMITRQAGKIRLEGHLFSDHVTVDIIGKGTVADLRQANQDIARLVVETGKPMRTAVVEERLIPVLERNPAYREIERYVPEDLKGAREIIERRTGRPLTTELGARQFEMSVEDARKVPGVGVAPGVEAVPRGVELSMADVIRLNEGVGTAEGAQALWGKGIRTMYAGRSPEHAMLMIPIDDLSKANLRTIRGLEGVEAVKPTVDKVELRLSLPEGVDEAEVALRWERVVEALEPRGKALTGAEVGFEVPAYAMRRAHAVRLSDLLDRPVLQREVGQLLTAEKRGLPPFAAAPGVERGAAVRPDFPPYETLPPKSSGYVYHTTGGFGESGETVLRNIRLRGELTAGVGQDEVFIREAAEEGREVLKEFGIPKVYFDYQPAWEYGGETPLVLRMKRSREFPLTEGFDAWYTKKSVPAERLEWYGADGTWHPVVEPPGPGTYAPVGPPEWETRVPVDIGEIEEVGGFPARFPSGAGRRASIPSREPVSALGGRPPGGPGMPPPVEPPVPGGLPPPEAYPILDAATEKLSTLIKQAKKPLRGQTLLRHEEMQRRFGQVAERLRTVEGTPIEVAARARAALGGERAKITFEPVLPGMTGEEVQALVMRANTFDFGLGRTAENVRVADALMKALLGELPQQAEQVLLEQVFGKQLMLALRGKGPISHQVYRNLIDLMALPKTALTFLDHSFPGRQGIKLAASHPAAWTKSAWYGIKAGARERVAQDMVRARALDSTPILVREGETVRTIPYGKLKEMAGVYEASFAEAVPLAAREEAFISHWARAIPLWGKGVKISERMYITSGNEIRHDVTRGLLQAANRGGEPIEFETAKGLAALNNRASGRGTIGIDEFAPVLNSLFFAPRYRISPVQWTAHLLHRDPVVRKEAARQVVSFVTAGATLMALLKYSGLADVNIDPTSADFGKARVGKTRIDIWAHLQQIARSVSMLITGERMTSTGEKVDVDREEIAWRYFRTGLAPIPGLGVDIRTGETIIGEEMEPSAAGIRTQLWNRLTPLAWQDIVDGVREEGARGGMISALALAGIGIMTYETYAQERARDFQKETGMDFDYANSGHWAILRTNPALKEKYGELGDVAQETQDFLTEQMTELGLPDMAQRMSSGTADPQVYTSFREAWEDFEGIRAKAAARMAYGRDRDPADDPVFQRYMEIDRDDPKYKDPVTFEINYGAYRRDKDAAFDNLDPAIQMAFQAVGAPDPEVAEWATLYVMSRNLRRQLYGMSKWEGLTPEQSRRLDQFTREVSRRAPTIAEQMGRRVSEASVAQALAEEQGAPGLAEWFIALQSSTKRDRMRDPDYEGFIAENKVGLQLFYPDLYSQALLERIGAIEGAPPGMGPMQPMGMESMAPVGAQ